MGLVFGILIVIIAVVTALIIKKKKEENEKKVKENSNDSNMKLIRFIKRQMFNNRRNICYINYYFYIYKHCQ